jgi:hypothetical protein
VPEHIVPRQVPDPDVAVRRPEPIARFIPLVSVTLMLPALATRPDASINGLFDETWPLLMPIETVAAGNNGYFANLSHDVLLCWTPAPFPTGPPENVMRITPEYEALH